MFKGLVRKILISLMLTSVLLLSGCASMDPDLAHPADPYEDFNRSVYALNSSLDAAILKPVAQGYNAIVPEPVNQGVSNFFNNLSDVKSAANNLLQFKIGRAVSDVGRVVINSTIGIGGLIDVASNIDIPRYNEDFGQTLGAWGIESGPYLVLPVFGPSSARDGLGLVVDTYADPVYYVKNENTRWGLRGLNVIDERAKFIASSRILDQAALDPYSFTRDAYLQKRKNDVYDGNPPEELDDF